MEMNMISSASARSDIPAYFVEQDYLVQEVHVKMTAYAKIIPYTTTPEVILVSVLRVIREKIVGEQIQGDLL